MKILLLSAINSVHTIKWANAFVERGHSVFVASLKNHSTSYDADYDKRVNLIKLKFSSPLGYYFCAKELKKLAKEHQFDAINVHYASGYGTLGRKAGFKGALLTLWGSDVYEYPTKNAFNRRVLIKNLKYYKGVSSTSLCMINEAKKYVERDYDLVPFGVNVGLFNVDTSRRKDITIGTVKTLKEIYRIEDSIRAFSLVCNRLKEENRQDVLDALTYEIYGKGEQKEYLQNLIDSLNLKDKIKLRGYVKNNELPSIINTFSVFCCCSRAESFGVAVVEAMACGVPVVVSDAEGFLEVVVDKKTGLISKKLNVESIADNLYTLITNASLREEYGKYAREHAIKKYDFNQNVSEMLKVYERLK